MNYLGAVLHGPRDLRIENFPIPEINDDEVLIKVSCVGICGSDVKLYETGKCGLESLDSPIVMGHEGAGVIVKVGSNVRSVKVGDRVAIEPTQPYRSCECCKRGRYNLLPDNLSMEEGATLQPLAIVIHACNRAGIKLGTELVILEAGPIGVLCAMAAKAMGATRILITDVLQSRLDNAEKLNILKSEYIDENIVDKIIDSLVPGLKYRPALDAVSSRAINLKSFITHHYPLE